MSDPTKPTREEVIALARQAGLIVYEGYQDRVVFEGRILDALSRLIVLARATQEEKK